MNKTLVLLTLLGGLAGCAVPPSQLRGNFNANTSPASNRKMAADAVTQLVALYPPASTTFSLQHPTPDVFGTSLIEAVRQKGYAILEFKPTSQGKETSSAVSGLPFGYILDSAPEANIHRVTLQIGNQTLTRAYIMQAGTVHTAGSWVRKE